MIKKEIMKINNFKAEYIFGVVINKDNFSQDK